MVGDVFENLWSDTSPQLNDVKYVGFSHQFGDAFFTDGDGRLNEKAIIHLAHLQIKSNIFHLLLHLDI